MPYPMMNTPTTTINSHEAVTLFHQLMQPDSQVRIVRLMGDAKMGKSHLLTKVFPTLARRDYAADCAIIDLRNQVHTILDILQQACSQLGPQHFTDYTATCEAWASRPKVSVRHLFAVFSSVKIAAKETADNMQARDRQLTARFTQNLATLNAHPILLLIDSVGNATDVMQSWLMEGLLVQLMTLEHVRVVVAGRSLPEAHGSYTTRCKSYRLQAIRDESEYITYCKTLNAQLVEQSIRDIANMLDYTPGMFVDLVLPKFVPEGKTYG